MILFFEYGRLGNQLFQYCGFKQYFPTHELLFVGCEDLQRNFNFVNARFISKRKLGRWISFGFLKRVILFLVAARILGRVVESKESEVFKLNVRRGLLWNLYVPQNVFFQHHDFINRIHNVPFLKLDLIKVAHDWLSKKGIDPNSSSLVFVHIRRGDYLYWPSKEFPAVLDLAWYKRAMESMQRKIESPVFIIMSDDQCYLHDVFEESVGKIISDNEPAIDMALMSLCHSGILSASSFAWWGAFFAHSKQKDLGRFLAPKYWAGHRTKNWYPTGFNSDWITYLE